MPAPLLRRPAPASYFHPFFLIFQIPHLQGRYSKFTTPSLKKLGGGLGGRTMICKHQDITSTLKVTIVFSIHVNFFILLSIWLDICRSNEIFFFTRQNVSQRFYMPNRHGPVCPGLNNNTDFTYNFFFFHYLFFLLIWSFFYVRINQIKTKK